jgi:hypothetical protein
MVPSMVWFDIYVDLWRASGRNITKGQAHKKLNQGTWHATCRPASFCPDDGRMRSFFPPNAQVRTLAAHDACLVQLAGQSRQIPILIRGLLRAPRLGGVWPTSSTRWANGKMAGLAPPTAADPEKTASMVA